VQFFCILNFFCQLLFLFIQYADNAKYVAEGKYIDKIHTYNVHELHIETKLLNVA